MTATLYTLTRQAKRDRDKAQAHYQTAGGHMARDCYDDRDGDWDYERDS